MTHEQRQIETDRARIEREGLFWNQQARTALGSHLPEDFRTGPNDRHDRTVPWLPYIGMPAYIERLLLEIGDVSGKPVLDLGTGSGFLAALLAARGAQVDAVDVSDASLELARIRAGLSGVSDRVRTSLGPTARASIPTGSADPS